MRQVFAAAALATGLAAGAAHAQEMSASAEMKNAEGEAVGTVTIEETQSGMLHFTVEMEGLEPGPHGFHVHETGKCDAADGFKSAGGHYAGEMEHGIESMKGPHPGDFPNVVVDENGVLEAEFFTDRLAIGAEGKNPLMDEDGSAVVLHAKADDYKSQPSGDAGDRIACGVIEEG
jgi:Cu-Zn family superoxide dismutase